MSESTPRPNEVPRARVVMSWPRRYRDTSRTLRAPDSMGLDESKAYREVEGQSKPAPIINPHERLRSAPLAAIGLQAGRGADAPGVVLRQVLHQHRGDAGRAGG